ncbi:MAG TPA: hypothetical protein VMV19_17580 [Xanthobacteraceae bacterium]|nr:hypothetical protein [Xanthobacteraceae bacterium]
MQIDRALNLVVPVEMPAGPYYVHSAPIGREVFEKYYLPISRAYSQMFALTSPLAGPRVAALLLRDAAQGLNRWDGEDGVERGLMAEIYRLSNVIMPTANGWTTVPFEEVRGKKLIAADDLSEVENSIVFFTLASVMPFKKERPRILDAASNVWSAQFTSLNVTEYAASLPTSNVTGNTGANGQAKPMGTTEPEATAAGTIDTGAGPQAFSMPH